MNRFANSSFTDLQILHYKLGHVPFNKMQHFPFDDYVASCLNHKGAFPICQIYPKARQHRSSFSISQIKTSSPFEMIHVDIRGPYSNSI